MLCFFRAVFGIFIHCARGYLVRSGAMSERSLRIAERLEAEKVRKPMSEPGVESPVQLRRSTRSKQPSKLFLSESYTTERARTLFNYCLGYDGTLSRCQGIVQHLMDGCGTLEDLEANRKSYDDVLAAFCENT